MLKKITPMICSALFIMSQACFSSASNNPDFDQIGRFQLAMILCTMAEQNNKTSIRNFIGTTLLGPQWQSSLQTHTQTAQTNLSWSEQNMRAAQTNAYCYLHVQARETDRQDVIDLIQHGR